MTIKMISELSQTDKHTIDIMGLVSLAGVFANILPSLVLFLTLIWTALRIYETDTVQKILGKGGKDGEGSDSK